MYEVFEHTADLGLRVRSATLEELLCEAAEGLFSMLVVNLAEVRAVDQREYHLPPDALDYLLFDWLNELLYTFETERLLFREFQVRLDEEGLHAVCRGETMDLARHVMDHEVKAITYHELHVRETDEGWVAEVIVDI